MANKGLPFYKETFDTLWVAATHPLLDKDTTMVYLDGADPHIAKYRTVLIYNKDAAAIGSSGTPGILAVKAAQFETLDEILDMITESLQDSMFVLKGPIKFFVTKVSPKHVNLRLLGKNGEITVWQKQHKSKTYEWGLYIRIGAMILNSAPMTGRVIDIYKARKQYETGALVLQL